MGRMPARERPERWRTVVDDLPFRILASQSPAPSASWSPARSTAPHPPVVLVHGIGVSHRYLARLHTVLAHGGRTVYSVDLPGFGGLPKPTRDLDVPAMAAALAELIESLAAEPVVLVGHSMGSQWAVEVGIQHPELVSHVVAMGPVADARHRSVWAQTVALAKDTFGEAPEINALVFSDYVRCGIPWYLTQLRHMLSYPIEDRVGSLARPLTIVRGARDPIAGLDWCRTLRDRAMDADLVLIPGQHHVAQHGAPRAVAAAILAHVP